MEDNERKRWVNAKRLQAPLDGLRIVRVIAERDPDEREIGPARQAAREIEIEIRAVPAGAIGQNLRQQPRQAPVDDVEADSPPREDRQRQQM
jgi:hypothetical protein